MKNASIPKLNSKQTNQQRAPISAAFVEEMRRVFGEVKVLYVKEGNFEIGRKP
jgi:hypothetical protein